MRKAVILLWSGICVLSTYGSVVPIPITSFPASAAVADFVGPSSNPYAEAGATFSSTQQNVSGSTLNVTDVNSPILNIVLPFASGSAGLTNRVALPLTVSIQLFGDLQMRNLVGTLTSTVSPYDFNQPLTVSFLGFESTSAFESLRINATNSFSLADFRFAPGSVAEPSGGTYLAVAALLFAAFTFSKR